MIILPKKGEIKRIKGKVVCHICGKTYDKLGAHVYHAHKMSTLEYKKQFGLNKNADLTSEKYKKSIIVTDEQIELLKQNSEKTKFKVGNEGRKKDKISEQEMKRLKERCKNGVFRKVLRKI